MLYRLAKRWNVLLQSMVLLEPMELEGLPFLNKIIFSPSKFVSLIMADCVIMAALKVLITLCKVYQVRLSVLKKGKREIQKNNIFPI